ncbi:hypothetical protein A2154_00920 [Candidatus Gottesmanbacteria bacterium RBG_16_43_7]|uniref:Uncharacterized protein n=1 Tax=Candidatus Gottesmanbacteria bacterium RBG_16_43_7 TaxID=1798373 RepID=A0A1F5Z9B6_9BACT|nr:MAG: hypothetical protein A2154_00920 [Candidatus Gottesmanbacteria bacterium RBG_16_43_7]
MDSKKSKNRNFTALASRLFRLFGGSALILCSIFLFLFVSVIWKRDNIIAKNLVELLFKEIFIPHKSPFLYLFTAALIAGKFVDTSIFIKRYIKVSFAAAILVTLLFQYKNIGRWFVMRDIVNGFKIVKYERNPGQPFDVMPYSDISIKNNRIKAEDLETLINSRINKRNKLIQAFGYGKHSTAKIWISKRVPQKGWYNPHGFGYDYNALAGIEYIYLRVN